MSVTELLAELRSDVGFMANIVAWRTLHEQPAAYAAIPSALHPALQAGLRQRGISQLYTHQADAVQAALDGHDVVIVTPTASGKTLCYNLPVFHALLNNPDSRALYLFPTKALTQDQLAEVNTWRLDVGSRKSEVGHPTSDFRPPTSSFLASTYDGDTPSAERARIRKQAQLILSNPDMLHMGILPNHAQWAEFFAGLRYVVLDELHTYRGVFGSHVANVLRRLLRICAFYGSRPQFICTSATIANPQQLAERLLERPVHLVERNGAPRAEKHVLLYNPPLYDAEHGLRRSAILETEELAARCIVKGAQTIVFGRTRLTTELLLTYLREQLQRQTGRWLQPDAPADLSRAANLHTAVRGYRGGYLPAERRAIEAGLRSGALVGVVATNALELGIDIGQLQVALLCGYPGSIASTWQQIGRAGRTKQTALAILVATGLPIDQYIVQHPEFIFERSPEHALTNPDNLMLLVDQMRCAAAELPFRQGDGFGASSHADDVFDLLLEQGDIQRFGERLMWCGSSNPARQINLRSIGNAPVVIQVDASARLPEPTRPASAQIIGEIDDASALTFVHDGAIYLHEGQSYHVTRLDLEERIAHVAPVDVDYYTSADHETTVTILAVHAATASAAANVAHGDLRIDEKVVGYRRRKRFTHELLGAFTLDYPPQTLETTGYWFSVTPETQLALAAAGDWFDWVNDYGPNWQTQRERVRKRDNHRCTQCGAPEPTGRQHDVHHAIPFRTFGYAPGLNDNYLLANRLENLLLVCRTCHQRLEMGVRTRGALDGLGYILHNLAPLYLMCDRADLDVHVERSETQRPAATGAQIAGDVDFTASAAVAQVAAQSASANATITIYERIPAGLGFSALLYELHDTLLAAAQDLIAACGCSSGCPACVGPVLELQNTQLETKRLTLRLVEALRGVNHP